MTLAHREEEAHQPLSFENKELEAEGEEEDDHEPFVYPGESSGTASEPQPAATSAPVAEQECAPSVPLALLETSEFSPPQAQRQSLQSVSIVVENPPPSHSPSPDVVSEAPCQVFPRDLEPPPPTLPSPAQLESLYAAASSGDLLLLKRLFRNAVESNDVQQFSLANDASTRTGFTALHAAASRGYLDIVQWRECVSCCFCILWRLTGDSN